MKLNIKNYVNLILLMLLASRCSVVRNQYSEGNFVSRSSISLKPSYRDSTEKATYISGSLHTILDGYAFNRDESSAFGLINVHKALTKKHMNFSYGAYLHAGNYNVNGYRLLSGGKKSFWGGGLNSEINCNIPFRYIDWRIIGAKISYQYENGQFNKFRKDAKMLGIVDNEVHQIGSFRLNFTSELVVKLKKIDLGVGLSIRPGEFTFSGSKIFLSAEKITFYLERSVAISQNDGQNAIFNGFGLAYRLK